MAPNDEITRYHKTEGANEIMDKGYLTERDMPEMMALPWSEHLLEQVNDELRLRSLTDRAVLKKFNYYMGSGIIIYNPNQLTEDQAKQTLQKALGYRK
ncbi:hypothetical protein [Lacticaseibacillus saniviri]|uniref:Uncharacterized protein n=1 Tax=Lacticaseibacillus saniviri JCM 17471 = DSM 24301 TaxID=1293598 RepID=A0A0R2MPA3_9LACO|nr:hypothetical protein [Lacticaseibacillus saniviri]KRO15481.1 hypothetical protein IV56_GL002247 [Lacticaseibacillus saniviri JCM 17471 = DSM 24301]MCG4281313.1 hypothetical protein [Lacticaseibacillus saniviri]